MFLLEAGSPEEKKEWIAALWTNVFYANPAKRHCGVAYTVELQVRYSPPMLTWTDADLEFMLGRWGWAKSQSCAP